MRKQLLIGLLCLFALGAVALPFVLGPFGRSSARVQPLQVAPVPPDVPNQGWKINEENFKKIETGMTEKQVVDILGAPGVHTARDTYYYTPPLPSMGYRWKKSVDVCLDWDRQFPTAGCKTWYGNKAFISIYFSPDGKVTEHGYAGGKYLSRAYLVTDPDPYPSGK